MMENGNGILIRDAEVADAPFIARCVLAGIEMLPVEAELPAEMQPMFDHLVGICLMDDTLYSYRNTVVAEIDGTVAGALVAYDGADYAAMRQTTFNLVERNTGVKLNQNAMETGAGEYYLDSMAIKPQYRGRNIGKMLMQNRMKHARNQGIAKVTLLVDIDKPRLQAYYESLGFAFIEQMFVFGSWYNKLGNS